MGFILFFPLLLLYAEAATLGAAESALHKLRAPWGICAKLNLRVRLLFFLHLCFANGGGRRGGEWGRGVEG